MGIWKAIWLHTCQPERSLQILINGKHGPKHNLSEGWQKMDSLVLLTVSFQQSFVVNAIIVFSTLNMIRAMFNDGKQNAQCLLIRNLEYGLHAYIQQKCSRVSCASWRGWESHSGIYKGSHYTHEVCSMWYLLTQCH